MSDMYGSTPGGLPGHEGIFELYGRADAYNRATGLYDTVEQNENFYIGRQWEGLAAPDLEKPVLNFIRRVVNFFISMIVSDDVSATITPLAESEPNNAAAGVLSREVERIIERTNAKSLHRELLRSMAVDGDGCFYLHFNPEIATGGEQRGEVEIECVETTRVLFGNPNVWDVQRQPHVLIVFRETMEAVRREMAAQGGAGRRGDMQEQLVSDSEQKYGERADGGEGLVTVVLMLKRDPATGTIWAAKATRGGMVKPWFDTGYRLYPVARASWDRVRSSYHGQAVVTGLVPNQIFVNKLWAMAMEQVKLMAFPKIIYNKTLLPGGWTNGVGRALGVAGNPQEAVASAFRAPDMSAQVLELVQRTIDYTRDFMGASDSALGNVRPDNTSAIIAVQKASSMPLELQRLGFYQFVEDYVRILLELMRVHYGVRPAVIKGDMGAQQVLFDYSAVSYDALQLRVDVGSSAYWSEIMQAQTLDNLYAKGVITDAVTYLEGVPDSYIKNKNKLIARLREQESLTGQLAARQMGVERSALPGV